jgi:hypothetical protein
VSALRRCALANSYDFFLLLTAKPFARFLWEVFAGWDWIAGYRKGEWLTP